MKKNYFKIAKSIVAASVAAMMAVSCAPKPPIATEPATTEAATTEAAASPEAKKAEPSKGAKTIKLGSVVASTHPSNAALIEVFKPMVEEKSNGSLKVEIYDSGKLGGEKELYDNVRNGNIQLAMFGTVMWNEVEKMSVPDWPFLFRDLDHARKVYTGEIGAGIATSLEEKIPTKLLAWFPNGIRVFSSNRTIEGVDGFKGLKLRMPNNPIHIKVAELLGAAVNPMPLSEVFTALEQKVVDGQDNPLATFKNEGWYEVQSDIYESNHMITSLELLANNAFFESLTDEERAIIKEAALAASEKGWDAYKESVEADKKFLEEQGVKFTTPTDADREALKAKMKPIYDDFYAKYDWAEEMVKQIEAVQ